MWKRKLLFGVRNTLLALASIAASVLLMTTLGKSYYLPDSAVYFDSQTMPADVRGQLNRFYFIWDDPQRHAVAQHAMAEQNPEWDLISRTFFAYSLANVALQYPDERERALKYLDQVIADTMTRPWQEFVLPYAFDRPYVVQPVRSIMIDGEVALMIGLRRLVRDDVSDDVRRKHDELNAHCIRMIEAGAVLCGESYPNECWLWCTPLALASVRVHDVLEGEDHGKLFRLWESVARERLVDPRNGLIKSAVTLNGKTIHPPEGSTIWIGAQCLLAFAPDFAREQYALMKEHLSGRLLCFQFGREWPRGLEGEWDIDSGFTPFGMGPASTGFALVASKEFGDLAFFSELTGLLNLVGVPQREGDQFRYLSSNLVGDATFLYAKTTGPAWAELERRAAERKAEP